MSLWDRWMDEGSPRMLVDKWAPNEEHCGDDDDDVDDDNDDDDDDKEEDDLFIHSFIPVL